jgi:hypothetical protein
MYIMRLLLGLPLLGVLAMPAVAGSPQAEISAPPPYVVDCVQRVESPPTWPPRGWRKHAVLAGPVAFFGLREQTRQPVNRTDRSIGTETPALVAAERQVTIVARTPGLRLYWGDGGTAVTLKACPRRQRSFGFRLTHRRFVGRHTQFLGGFAADHAGCMTFDVYVYGRAAPYHRRFGLGAPCTGG